MKALVIGGTGAVGRQICHELTRVLGPDAVVVGDHRIERGLAFVQELGSSAGSVHADVTDEPSLRAAIAGVDGVIVAVAQKRLLIQEICHGRSIPCVDIVPDNAVLAGSDGDSPAGVVGAGLIPGLSATMALAVVRRVDNGHRLNVSLLQRANGSAGPVGITDMLRLFTRPVDLDGRPVRGFSVKRRTVFPPPFGLRALRAVAFPEARDLSILGDIRAQYWTAFDSPVFNAVIGAANRLGILSRLVAGREPPGLVRSVARRKAAAPPDDERVALMVDADDGPSLSVVGPSDYAMTAMVAVAALRLLWTRTHIPSRTVRLFELFSFAEIVEMIDSPELAMTRA